MEETSLRGLEDFPEYHEAKSLLAKAQHELLAAERQLDALHGSLSTPAVLTLQERARNWLRGDDASPTARSPQREQIDALHDKRRLLTAAVQEQRQRLASLGSELSKRVCEELKPDYTALVRRIAETVEALAKLLDEEQAFRDRLRDGGIEYASYLRTMNFPACGKLSDPYSNATAFLTEARTYYLNPPEPPTPPEKKPPLRRMKEAVVSSDTDWAA
jgi:NADH dehydrogenase/NADH:ubiquinone oxidoreductase subunit G